jgi:hypothetical protein
VQDSDAEEEEEESEADEEVTDSVRAVPVRRRRPQPVRVKPAELKVWLICIFNWVFQSPDRWLEKSGIINAERLIILLGLGPVWCLVTHVWSCK